MKPEYSETKPVTPAPESARLARRLGLFDATMIVMGGIIGSGIFINAYIVARQVHTPLLILGAWAVGGLVALVGAFVYAELAALRPEVGGQYAYLREAFHPLVAFIYGWTLLLVTQTGGMAAVAVTFANYFISLTHAPVSDWSVAVIALAVLTVINCFGVRTGSNVQSALMVMKIVAIVALVACGLGGSLGWFGMRAGASPNAASAASGPLPALSFDLLTAMAAAMIPVLFAYGGWQTSSFVAGEVREPRKNLPLALLLGVVGVIALYLAVNFVYIAVLGVNALSETQTPASELMRRVLGERGQTLIAVGIAISTLGFLSQGMLTAPRVYFAMAEDGLFFKSVAWVDPRTRVPVVAIALQGVLAIVIALSGTYSQILNYVVSVDSIFFGLTAACIFVFRSRASGADGLSGGAGFRAPGHPVTTILFIAVEWLVAATTFYKFPGDSFIGMAILLAGIPIYFLWRGRRKP